MSVIKTILYFFALISAGGLFGFFFTMNAAILPGLDQTDPLIALNANQEIGRATQSGFFAVLLIGLPISLLLLLALKFSTRDRDGRIWLFLALLGFLVMLISTFQFNVPLNQTLDALSLEELNEDATTLWQDYSSPWQRWNTIRIIASAISLLAMGMAFKAIGVRR